MRKSTTTQKICQTNQLMNLKNHLQILFLLSIGIFSSELSYSQCTADIPYPIDDPCVQIVIANDPFCCNNTWDGLCQSAYDDCDPGGGGGCEADAPYPDDDPCYIQVITNDTFCCDTSWDGICQSSYDECDPGGGGGGPIVVSDDTYTIPELVTEVLLGSCVDASNITFSGNNSAFGNFTNGNEIGFEEGIIMSSGSATDAPGPEGFFASTSHGEDGDPDLEGLINIDTYDAAIIEFDFESPTDFVSFEYIFASEEYQSFTCATVNDVFGFFISGPGFADGTNVALVPGTTTPVSINTVNGGGPTGSGVESNCADIDPNYADYTIYYNNNYAPEGEEIAYGGYTDVFTVELDLVPCETYHIKLAIADGGDSSYDSAVFLKAGSFTSGLEVDVVSGTSTASIDALEGCEDGYFMFINQGPEITEPTVFEFEIGGTATMGDDYAVIDNTVTFQPGQDTVIVYIEAFLDGIDEGTETIILTFSDACSCDEDPEAQLNILDNDVLSAEITDDLTICNGSGTTLEVLNAEGSESTPYSYLWSTGADTPSIDVNPAVTTTYDVTVTDACGGQSIDLEVTVNVASEITVDIDEEICDNESYELPDGTNTSDAGLYTFDYLTDDGCDSIVNINLSIIEIPETIVEAGICDGESYTLPDGTEVDEAGAYDVILTSADGCDSLVITELEIWSNYEVDENAAICDGETFMLPDGTDVDVADVYSVTLQTINGCDSVVNTTLEVYPTYTQTVEAFVCGDGGYTLPDGNEVFVTGEYEVILSTINGCDSVITTNLEVQDLVVVDLEPVICDSESYALPDGTNTNAPGVHEVMVGADGCDTLYVIDLDVHPTYEITVQDTICEGEQYPLPGGEIVTTGGMHSVLFETINGCDSLYNVELTVLVNPIASFSVDPKIASVYDGPVQFFNESMGASTIEWEIEEYGTYEVENPVIDFNGIPGKYDVCLYTENDFGCNDLYCIIYEVQEDFTVYIPNAFSPNEDGINDQFFVQGMDIDPQDFLLQIFNRYGELIFETKDPTEKWNGEEPGKEHYSETEIYVYRVTVGSLSGMEKQEFTGKVTALR